jgi:hypothetical protein
VNITTQQLLVAAAIAGMIGVAGTTTTAHAKGKNSFKCEGVNKCKGKGACKSGDTCKAHSNACKGKGFAMVKDEAACNKMKEKMGGGDAKGSAAGSGSASGSGEAASGSGSK